MTRILFLYSEVMGYTMALFRSLRNHHQTDIKVIFWDEKRLTPFVPDSNDDGLEMIPRSEMKLGDIMNLIKEYQPNLIYVSGWMDREYLKAVRYGKREGCTIVSGLDTPWSGTIRQRISSLVLKRFWQRHFDYFWIPGKHQQDYAVHLGFGKKILPYLYSADLDKFRSRKNEQDATVKTLLFVGRISREKNIMMLCEEFIRLKPLNWKIRILGNGPLEDELPKDECIEFMGFQAPEIVAKHMQETDAFCLPSQWEPWGVVVHEAAASGLPLILSKNCGSAEAFLDEGINGWSFDPADRNSLRSAMNELFETTDEDRLKMGMKSKELSETVTPDLSAKALMSVINDNRN